MQLIPEISSTHPGVVVEALTFHRPLFGLFGTPRWTIQWRLVDDPCTQSTSELALNARSGESEIAGQVFAYTIRWRPDLRRRRGLAPEPALLTLNDCVVTPAAVLTLAESGTQRDRRSA
ncbi:MAG: hypothetical protein AAF933_06050 [Pseudomonadota bacterium]